MEKIYDEMGEGTGPTEGQYQELKLEEMEERQYEGLNKGTTAKA